MPRVSSTHSRAPAFEGFPVDCYAYSHFQKFSTNPYMFKVNILNGDYLDTTSSPTNILGRAGHLAMQTYFGGNESVPVPPDDGEAMRLALEAGRAFLDNFADGLIEYNTVIGDRAKLNERYAFAMLAYFKELGYDPAKQETLLVEKMLKRRVSVDGKDLPVPLKGSADWVYRDKKSGRIIIHDHKFVSSWSSEDKIDGSKLLQAVFNYLLVYAELGEAPYSMVFAECKITANKDGGRQTKEYEIVFAETPLAFDLFFRFYDDMTQALLGRQVYVPNIMAIFDQEVSLLAYIHRLDVDEEKAKQLKALKVDNITDLLKKRIMREGAMKKYLETVTSKFISGTMLNYKDLPIPERIKAKLAEHGLGVEFNSSVTGSAVTLYRYEPSVGLKMSRIEKFVKDLEQVTGTTGIRVLAPIPGSELVGFELPNKERTFPGAAPETKDWELPVGVDVAGKVHTLDPRSAPHILVAGATGAGKSVFLTSLVSQLSKRKDARLVLLDPKKVELSEFEDVAGEYADDIMAISAALADAVKEMELRYKLMKEAKVKDLAAWRAKGGKRPYIFVVIDEYGDLIAQQHEHTEEVEDGVYLSGPRKGEARYRTVKTDISGEIRRNLLLLAQKARAAGIHLVITTQHPIAKIVDSAIKANFPTRIAFRTASASGSQVIIDQDGAETLMGKGDMLLQRSDGSPIIRLQGYSI